MGLARVMRGEVKRTFQPIGGLHHAGRDHAAGFCVFNDLGVVIETLRRRHGVRRVAYIDIDVHHGDGVYLRVRGRSRSDLRRHPPGRRTLYPGTGHASTKPARARPRAPSSTCRWSRVSGDAEFFAGLAAGRRASRAPPADFYLFQCGADGLKGDPLAHLEYSAATHALAAKGLRRIAERFAKGRMMAFGGGGYDRRNLAMAWSAVLREMAAG